MDDALRLPAESGRHLITELQALGLRLEDASAGAAAVSYTHLTLPTIYSV